MSREFKNVSLSSPSIDKSGVPRDPIALSNLSSLNVAKCNFGKVNLEAKLASSFPSYTRGGPMPLAGAPRDLYTQLLACSSSQSVVAIACHFAVCGPFCALVFSCLLFLLVQ